MIVSHAYLHVQQLVTQLPPQDQARLLEYLSSRLAYMLSARWSEPSSALPRQITTWQEFFRVGDDLMNTDRPDSQTLTAAVLEMRR